MEEVESPWSLTPWVGVVRKSFSVGDCYVTPRDIENFAWRTDWSGAPERAQQIGLYLTRDDRTTLLEPARPEGAERAA